MVPCVRRGKCSRGLPWEGRGTATIEREPFWESHPAQGARERQVGRADSPRGGVVAHAEHGEGSPLRKEHGVGEGRAAL